jgi:hypothetical protein
VQTNAEGTGALKGEKMKRVAETILTVVNIFIVSMLSGAAAADTLPETAKLLPPETILLVNVEDFNQTQQRFEKTSFYRLYKDPAMTAFVTDAKDKWREKSPQQSNKIVQAILDAGVLPEGRVAVALVTDEQNKEANEPIVLFITQWGKQLPKITEAVEKEVKELIEAGSHQKGENYRGVNIKTVTKEDSTAVSYCFFKDCLIGATNVDVLKFTIAHIKGASIATLADDSDYTTTLKTTGPYHDIDFYVNIKQIIKTAVAHDASGEVQTTIDNLGLDNITAFGCSVSFSRQAGSSCGGAALLKINGAKKGICRMLEVESATFKVPRFIPASTCLVTFINLNIKKAYDELYSILYNSDPSLATALQTPLLPPSPDGEPGVELKRDIIEHLGSQIVLAQSINKPFSIGSAPIASLVALSVSNRGALEKSLSYLHSMLIAPDKPDSKRELLGYTIYLFDFSSLLPKPPPTKATPLATPEASMQQPVPKAPPQTPAMAFTVTDTHLILGSESAVEKAIRTLSSSESAWVGSSKWFTSARGGIPSVVGLAGVEDSAASNESFWWMLKQGRNISGTSFGPVSFAFGSRGLNASINPALLPEFDAVRKYFGSSTLYGVSRADGFFFKFNYLDPPKTE